MAAEAGRNFLLKTGTATAATTISAQLQTSFSINGTPVDITNKDSAGMQTLLSGAGKRSVTIQANGILTATDAHGTLRSAALAGTLATYTLVYDTNDTLQGEFQITKYEASGDEGDASKFSIELQSSGTITLTST